ncbi:MAG: serine/threonine-protein kinase [Myxococcota bacterium]
MLLISPTIRFLRCLGSGGFGAVYLAEAQSQSGLSQKIAVKILNSKMSQIKDIVARQRDEARLLGMLNHDHIVKVYDLGEINHQSAIFMEYIEGVDLRQLSQSIPIPARIAILISAAVASALHAAQHTTNPKTGQPLAVIHRDIKPANILLSVTGIPKVLDFGIARGDFDREGETKSVQFGTAHYMAPEQLLYGTQSASVDVFALGLTLWDLLTQKPRTRLPLHEVPFNQKLEIMLQALHANRKHRSVISLLSRMLAYQPHKRPNAQTVEFELLQISDELDGPNLISFAKQHVRFQIKNTHPNHPLPQPSQSSNITIDGFKKPQTSAERVAIPSHYWGLMILIAALSFGTYLINLQNRSASPKNQSMPQIAIEGVMSPTKPTKTIPIQTEPPLALQTKIQTQNIIQENSRPQTQAQTQTQDNQEVQPTTQHIVHIHSIPAGMLIKLDGQQVGITPIHGLPIATGKHELTLVELQSGKEEKRQISIDSNSPNTLQWALEEGQWHMLF